MPTAPKYDPSVLKETLKNTRSLRSTESILGEAFGEKPWPISVSSVNKFVAGKEACESKIEPLEDLMAFLRNKYPKCLPSQPQSVPSVPEPAPEPGTLDAALMRFYTDTAVITTFPIEGLRSVLEGNYVMYRPDWLPRKRKGSFRASMVQIEKQGDGMQVTETQDYPDEGPDGYYQQDTGAVFSYGPHAYFLMRESSGGACVKLVVVTAMSHNRGKRSQVQAFQGFLLAASERGVFPRAKFYCCRYSDKDIPKFGRVRLGSIRDEAASVYLTHDDTSVTVKK